MISLTKRSRSCASHELHHGRRRRLPGQIAIEVPDRPLIILRSERAGWSMARAERFLHLLELLAILPVHFVPQRDPLLDLVLREIVTIGRHRPAHADEIDRDGLE